MNQLEPIIARTREAVARRRQFISLTALETLAQKQVETGQHRSFVAALQRPGLSLIAEHKRSSPSAGIIRGELALEDVVSAYERGGAAALSVLTEESWFGGSLQDLRAARAASSLPILRKDFIVDPYQVVESLAGGADAILLIVAALAEPKLQYLLAQATELGLAAVVEVHDERELELALAAGAGVIGINNRDLTTLRVDPGRAFELLAQLPAHVTSVAESGFSSREQLDKLAAAGAHAVLIGEALMRASDIEAACRTLTASAGSRAV